MFLTFLLSVNVLLIWSCISAYGSLRSCPLLIGYRLSHLTPVFRNSFELKKKSIFSSCGSDFDAIFENGFQMTECNKDPVLILF